MSDRSPNQVAAANHPTGQADGSDNLSAITVAIFVLVLSLLCGTSICDADGFDSVHCGADVQKTLLGSTMTNEKVSVIEERHTDLGLKDLGGTEISDRLFLISWRICGEEYALLKDQGVVRDVLKFPSIRRTPPNLLVGVN